MSTIGKFGKDSIIILFGAGASVQAGVPHSSAMISRVEKLINSNDKNWSKFRNLYYCIKGAIQFAEEIKGKKANYNIETLVATLDELAKRDTHPLYPFIGAWIPRLMEVTDGEFQIVRDLKDKIVEILRRDWIEIECYENAEYYENLVDFQQSFNFPLRIFTLNYDLCIELACKQRLGKYPERGFEYRKWDWRLFEYNDDAPREIFLYKLHGSNDWKYDSEDHSELTFVDSTASIKPYETAMIFGTTYKLQYVDPFLFLAYEFRRWTLEPDNKLIISIGYGFGDEHINGIISQSLKKDPNRKLLCVSRSAKKKKSLTEKLLDLNDFECCQVEYWEHEAKDFMENYLNLEKLSTLFPKENQLFDEIEP